MEAVVWGLGLLFVAVSAARWLERVLAREHRALGLPEPSPRSRRVRPWITFGLVISLGAGLVAAELIGQCLATPEVQPSWWGSRLRAAFHVGCVTLLVLGTLIDLDCFLLPDDFTLTGLAGAVVAAMVVGELQIAHWYVDWTQAIPQLRGPGIPEWFDRHRWLHGLVWSLTGAVVGAGITAIVRTLAGWILGQEAMGFGDVTLMAMIGSVVGWQAVLWVLALAPLTGVVFAVLGAVLAGRPYLPYGPCLSAAAVIVLFGWSTFWGVSRLFFSDLVAVVGILVAALAVLTVLLGAVRLYRSIPTRPQSPGS